MADLHYTIANSSNQENQFIVYQNNIPVNGLSSHLNLLEDFSPDRTIDPFHWIPYGLFYDLIDNRNDHLAIPLRVDIDDAVFGYTNQEMFNALSNDIRNLRDYRVRLLNNNGNNQGIQVTQLFNRYGF